MAAPRSTSISSSGCATVRQPWGLAWRYFPAVLLLACLFTSPATATVPVRQSEQFTVVDVRSVNDRSPGPLKTASGQALVRLDADVLLLSAERIRETLLEMLGLPKDEGGKIRLVLYMARQPTDLIRIGSGLTPDGWEYQVYIPDQVQRDRLVAGVVSILLLENANRGQGPKSAEIPLWLVEGLSGQVEAVGGPDLVLNAVPMGTMLRIVRVWRGADRRLDYLKDTRTVLQAHAPLSFGELAHPQPETLVGDKLKSYQASAHLFVAELLQGKEGAAHLVKMLRALPSCWNWETALLASFPGQFQRMLDVEKWWSVNALAFIARDPSQVWSRVASLNSLDQALRVPAQVRLTTDTIPVRTVLTLQEMLTDWTFDAQAPVLRQTLTRLVTLRFNAAPEVLTVINGYEQVLVNYLQRRAAALHEPETRMQATYSPTQITRDAIRDLERLDQQRKALRPEQSLTVNSPTND